MAGTRPIHFVDTQGSLGSLINGFSTDEDTSAVSCLYQFLVAALGISVWFEYAESPANLADGPSRDGMEWGNSKEARVLGAIMEEMRLPALQHLAGAPADFLSTFAAALENVRLIQI